MTEAELMSVRISIVKAGKVAGVFAALTFVGTCALLGFLYLLYMFVMSEIAIRSH